MLTSGIVKWIIRTHCFTIIYKLFVYGILSSYTSSVHTLYCLLRYLQQLNVCVRLKEFLRLNQNIMKKNEKSSHSKNIFPSLHTRPQHVSADMLVVAQKHVLKPKR